MEILEGGRCGADGLDSPRTHIKEDVLDRGVRLEKDPQLGQLEPMRIWVSWFLPPVAHTKVLAQVRAGADAVKVERALDGPRGVLGATADKKRYTIVCMHGTSPVWATALEGQVSQSTADEIYIYLSDEGIQVTNKSDKDLSLIHI